MRQSAVQTEEKYASPGASRLSTLANICPQWKVLVVDENSKKLIDAVCNEDDILEENVTSGCSGGDYMARS